ncbi:unnamed protein product [Alopecurus aequalis]
MAGARSDELRVTLLGLALLGLLLLSHTAAPVEATGGEHKDSFSMNGAGGRTLNSFSMNGAEGEKGTGKGKTGAGDF